MKIVSRRNALIWTGVAVLGSGLRPSRATESSSIEPQPYFASVNRVLDALAKVGAPVSPEDAEQLAALARQSDKAAVEAAERILDRYTLVRVVPQADGFARVSAGGAQRTLIEQGWRPFLVRV